MPLVGESPEVTAQPANEVNIVTSPENPDWQQGAALEARVFTDSNYVNAAEELAREYQPYLPNTEFVVVKREGAVVGSTRLIFHDAQAGFKTLSDINEGRLAVSDEGRQKLDNLDLVHSFEVGTLAVAPEMRASPDDEGRVAVALYAAIFGEYRQHESPNVLASFDEAYFNRFKGIFGESVQQLGPATEYMGSPTVPVLMNMEELLEHLRVTFPEMYETVLETAANVTHA